MRKHVVIGSSITAMITSLAFAAILIASNSIANAATVEPTQDTSHNPTRTLSVVGIAKAKVFPDQINISFVVESQGKTAQQAVANNTEITNAVIQSIKNSGLSGQELGTTSYSVYPIYEYVNIAGECLQYREGDQAQKYCPPPTSTPILVGYKAVNTVQVQSTQLDKAGQWIDVAVQAGANRIENLYFSLSFEREDEIRHGLIVDAVQNARGKATTAGSALGMEIVDVLNVNIDSYPIIYQKRGYEYSAGAPSPQTSIIAGIQEISVSVPVTFEIAEFSQASVVSNSTVQTTVNDEFKVTLTSNPSTGYHWQASSIDEKIVRLADDEYVAPDSKLPGASGKQLLTFEALKAGRTAIELRYVRPWDPEDFAGVYVIDLIVASNT